MPNWVKNIVRCDKLEEMRERYADEEDHDMEFSFVKVIPHPDDWSIYWAVKNWGTKWNAGYPVYIMDDGDPRLVFDTAWSMPDGIYTALAAQLGCEVDVEYADEDLGSNCGHSVYYPDGSEWFKNMEGDPDYAARLWGDENYESYLRRVGYTEDEIVEALEYWKTKESE